MESILKWLFSSDLCIGREEKEERNLAKEGAAVMEAAEKLCGILGCETVQILGSKITLYKRTDKKDFEHLLTP